MYKSKTIKIIFNISTESIDILPSISIYSDERNITFRWIIFEINMYF